jgi:prevent-host-death family protein
MMSTRRAMFGLEQPPAASDLRQEGKSEGNRFNQDGFAIVTCMHLNRNPSEVLRQASEQTVVVTRHQKTVAYVVSPVHWRQLEQRIKELEFNLRCDGREPG